MIRNSYCALLLSQLLGLTAIAAAQDAAPPAQQPKTQQPADNPAESKASADEEKTLSYWVSQLGHDHYLRREHATDKLIDAGPAVIPELVEVIREGDLEVVERALDILSRIAMAHAPDADGGAWQALEKLASESAGRRVSGARNAMEEIRSYRATQARSSLADAGIFVGMDDFSIGPISRPLEIVQIDDKWNGNVEKLQWLRWLSGIQYARVRETAIRSEVLKEVVQIPGLQTLAIVDGNIDEAGLKQLDKMSRIQSLEFRYVPLSDEQAETIGKLPIRVSLNLMGTGVSEAKVASMRDRLPGLEIEHRQGGFLGVSCNDSLDRCLISSVVPGSAAEQAGLLPEDVIVKVEDAKIERFRDLLNAINQYVPGDEVEVAFLRGEELQTVKLRLGRYEEM